MAGTWINSKRFWAAVATVLLAAAVPVGILWTLQYQAGLESPAQAAGTTAENPFLAQHFRNLVFSWVAVAAAALGAVLTGWVAFAPPPRPGAVRVSRLMAWVPVAAIVPLSFAILAAASHAASREFLPVSRLVLAVGAAAAFLPVALSLPGRLQYAVCCCVLGTGVAFFSQWEPPPPKPVPIAKHLIELEKSLAARLNQDRQAQKLTGLWKGQHDPLPREIETQLGADEYLNLNLLAPEGGYRVLVFITYNANAMSNIPHVPWVCMTQAGYKIAQNREDDVGIPAIPGKEIRPNVLLFEKPDSQARALMFQYFNVGGAYTTQRQVARFLATSGSIGHAGSYLSQTQVAVWIPPGSAEDPLSKHSAAYRLGIEVLNTLVPLLEREHYPDLHGDAGG